MKYITWLQISHKGAEDHWWPHPVEKELVSGLPHIPTVGICSYLFAVNDAPHWLTPALLHCWQPLPMHDIVYSTILPAIRLLASGSNLAITAPSSSNDSIGRLGARVWYFMGVIGVLLFPLDGSCVSSFLVFSLALGAVGGSLLKTIPPLPLVLAGGLWWQFEIVLCNSKAQTGCCQALVLFDEL